MCKKTKENAKVSENRKTSAICDVSIYAEEYDYLRINLELMGPEFCAALESVDDAKTSGLCDI